MAVVGVLVEAVVGHQHERVADLVAQVAQRDLHDAVGRVGARAARVLRAPGCRRGSPRARRGRRARAPPCGGSPGCAARRPASTRPARARRCPPSRTAARRGRRPRARSRRRAGAAPAVRRSRRRRRSGNVTAAMVLAGPASAGLEPSASVASSASTRPSIVCGSASASTRRPRSRGGRRRDRADRHDERLRIGERADERRRSSSTVDDDVNVIASTVARAHARERRRDRARPARCGTRRARRRRSRARARPSGSTSRACSARASSTRAPARVGLGERVEQRLGDEALGHEVGADAARGERARRCRARSPRPARPPSARASRPGRREAAVEERVDAVRRREHEPRRTRRASGSANVDRLDRDRGQLEHLGAELPRAASRSSLACSRARVTTTRAAEQRARARTRRGRARRRRRRRSRSAPRTPDVGDRRRAWRGPCAGRAGCRCAPRRPACRRARPPAIRRCGDLGDAARAHEDHERAAGAGERVPVDVGAALGRVLVAGDDGEVGRDAAVRDRDPGVRGARAIALVMPGTTSNGDAGRGAAPRPPRRRARTRTGRRP